ncbi:MAG: DEAD/DEAH box helicase [Acidobacteriota bacterium]
MSLHHTGFQGLGIAPTFIDILNKNNFTTPTPIQQQSIPVAIEGKDIIGIAQTGTGKTLAFGISMLQRLMQRKGKGLVVVPTRELALQVEESLQMITRPLGLKTAVIIGGEDIQRQHKQIRGNPVVVIATPGRLIDHLDQRTLRLDAVQILVLDEADRMLDMGFAPQIKRILEHLPKQRQTMLFSATMPSEIVSLAARYMQLPVRVEVAPSGTAAKDVSHELFFIEKQDKIHLLENLLSEYHGSILVFTRTKYEAKKIARVVRTMGHTGAEIHSNRSLSQRRDALQGFKLGRYRVLVATDIAARGIDVSGIELVVNYDLPMNAEDYVHRIGRTGRAGAIGHAISFVMPHQRADVKSIERVMSMALPVSPAPPALSSRRARAPQSPASHLGRTPAPAPSRAPEGRPFVDRRRKPTRTKTTPYK